MLRCIVFLLGVWWLLPAAYGFELESKGRVVWVADGDSFRFKPDNALMWVRLKKHAQNKQLEAGRSMRVVDRFRADDLSFLLRVGNVDTAEPATQAGRLSEAFSKALLEGESGTLYCWDIGYYGRPICSFWTRNWEFGEVLIKKGHSDYVTKFGRHPRLHQEYLRAVQAR